MTKQERFFYDQAGYSYDPKTETEKTGRERGAKHLAQAETYAREQGWYFQWEHEQERPENVLGKRCTKRKCNDPKCPNVHYGANSEWLCCILFDEPEGKVLSSLGMIEEPSREYRRVVEAELAWEAMPNETEVKA
jgi:hypothetical protein